MVYVVCVFCTAGSPTFARQTREASRKHNQVKAKAEGRSRVAIGAPQHVLASTLAAFERQAFARPIPLPGLAQTIRRGAASASANVVHVTPPTWVHKLKKPAGMPVRWDPSVVRYLNYYRSSASGRATIRTWLRRMGRYRRMIMSEIKRQHLPTWLVFVAMVESGFSPVRRSRAGAAGLWQFMGHSGEEHDLRRSHWVDERLNPERATRGALVFLKELKHRLGAWELALAAYNAGFGAVIAAMKKYNTNDYWRLRLYEAGLPWSTGLYVPKIMAVAVVAANRESFGLVNVRPEAELSYEVVAIGHSMTFAQLASAAGCDPSRIELLNPELVRGRTPPAPRAWVRIPPGRAKLFYSRLVDMERELGRYRPYVVRLGDTDRSIANRFRMARGRFRRVNGIRRTKDIKPGMTVLVQARSTSKRTRKPRRSTLLRPKGAAERYKESHRTLVPFPSGVVEDIPGKRRVFYRVVLGDTLARIATHLRVTRADLIRWNRLAPRAHLVSEMVLQAFVDRDVSLTTVRLLDRNSVELITTGSDQFHNEVELRRGRRRLTYRVRRGDTLKRIARRFGLSVGSLMRINRFGRNVKLERGQRLIVYVEKKGRRKARSRKKTSA